MLLQSYMLLPIVKMVLMKLSNISMVFQRQLSLFLVKVKLFVVEMDLSSFQGRTITSLIGAIVENVTFILSNDSY